MRLVFMVEEGSMAELLKILLPKIIPDNFEPSLVIPHTGKSNLAKSIPKKLQAWQNADDKFIIVHDQDSNDCKQLKSELLSLCENSRNDCLVRIVCSELESWYFGDLSAVSCAYERDYTHLSKKRTYRDPDKLKNAKQEFRKTVPTYQPIDGAKKIAAYMDINTNTSASFNIFISGIRQLCHVPASSG